MMAVANVHRELGRAKPYLHELTVNHEFRKLETIARDKNVTDMMEYIKSYENPFDVNGETETRLHNIVTQEVMNDEIRQSMTNIQVNGEELYRKFRQERLVQKQKALSDTIHRNNIKTLNSIRVQSPTETSLKKKKYTNNALGHRCIEICQARGNSTKELFKYDLIPLNSLFDADGLPKKPQKSVLCHELEKNVGIVDGDTRNLRTLSTAYIVDVMANLRKIALRNLHTFGDLCQAFVKMLLNMCTNADRIDFVFDSYIELSIKDSERMRRNTIMPIEIVTIKEDTPLPVSMDSFWASGKNKTRLQEILRVFILKYEWQNSIQVVLSGMIKTGGETPCVSLLDTTTATHPELDFYIEEADLRMIPHVVHSVCAGAERCILLSADTDVMVLGLHFFSVFKSKGLEELWIRAGVANSTRFIPLHTIATKKPELCKVLLAVHILTGCDITSKVGTKVSALKADPQTYLQNFGTNLDKTVQEETISRAEEYLVKVVKNGTDCTTMDELRYYIYHQSKVVDLCELPPTSAAIRTHILRCMYVCHKQMHYDRGVEANPADFGFECKDGLLLPINIVVDVPDNLVLVCKCTKCSSTRCKCRKDGVPCCLYCKCKSGKADGSCKNPHVLLSVPLVL